MELIIRDTLQKYVGKSVAVVNPETSAELGRPEYVAVNSFVYPLREDALIPKGFLAVDSFQRMDLRKAIGEKVTVVPTSVPPTALRVTLAPLGARLVVDPEFIDFVKRQLKDLRIPLTTGQTICVRVFERYFIFKVVEVVPSPGIFTETTELNIKEEVWTPPPPPPKGFEKKLPGWSRITEEEALKIEEEMRYRIKIFREDIYYFAESIEVKGGFVEFTPKLQKAHGEWYKPEFEKKILLPANRIEIIEDPVQRPPAEGIEEVLKELEGYWKRICKL
jgi:hypothetical protein